MFFGVGFEAFPAVSAAKVVAVTLELIGKGSVSIGNLHAADRVAVFCPGFFIRLLPYFMFVHDTSFLHRVSQHPLVPIGNVVSIIAFTSHCHYTFSLHQVYRFPQKIAGLLFAHSMIQIDEYFYNLAVR